MLTENQIKCIELLCKGITKVDIAEKLKINRCTIYDWLKNEEFKAELDKQQQDFLDAAASRLKHAAPVAADKLIALLEGKYEKTQLAAAIDLLDRGLGKATTKLEVTDKKDKTSIDDDILDKELDEVDHNSNE
jgi:orotate phosphoribosyltransferase-like protein